MFKVNSSVLIALKAITIPTAITVLAGCNGNLEPPKTIQECAALLPEGDLYMIEIRGVIDTGTKPPTIEGGFEVLSEGADEEELKPFSLCMRGIIQPKGENRPTISTSNQPD